MAHDEGRQHAATPAQIGISCVLVCDDRYRVRMMRAAVDQFRAQVYANKQLVIINGTGIRVTRPDEPNVKEVGIGLAKDLPLLSMRRIGVLAADKPWVREWDDDDVYHPLLLAYQAATAMAGHANVFSNQLRTDIEYCTSFVHRDHDGISGTVLYEKAGHPGDYDDDVHYTSDFALLRTLIPVNVVDNAKFPYNAMHSAVYHGHNVTPREEFMGVTASPEWEGRFDLNSEEIDYIQKALAAMGVSITKSEA